MTHLPAPFPIAAPGLRPDGSMPGGIAAWVGLLCALLAALLGLARARPRVANDGAAMALVARCAVEAEAPLFEEWVVWIAVPAPWRNGRLLPRRHEWAFGRVRPARRMRPRAAGRGPPWAFSAVWTARTGMA